LAEDERLARVELESKVAWRRIGQREKSHMASYLNRFAGESALIVHSPNDIEASTFALDIAGALQKAKWQASEPLEILRMREGPVSFGTNPPPPTGVQVWSTEDKTSREAALALVDQLTAMGFDANLSTEAASLLKIHPEPHRIVVSVEHKPEGAQGEYKLRQQASWR
jgi:hypothetical protein